MEDSTSYVYFRNKILNSLEYTGDLVILVISRRRIISNIRMNDFRPEENLCKDASELAS